MLRKIMKIQTFLKWGVVIKGEKGKMKEDKHGR
jgi:hypothetical protein